MKRLFVCALFAAMMAAAFAEPKNALLVANGNYTSFGSLNTPVKEAKELKKSLEKLGFAVTIVENAGREKILDSLLDFQRAVSASGGIAFFHYGGHAVQVAGKNYLIPVDADIPDERRVSSRAVDVDEVMASMQGETNIVILDACRNNPLPSSSGRSATRGLVMSEYKPANSIIVYSAQAGKVAQDGIFTPILTKKILEKKELGAVLRDVRKEVFDKTNGEQNPGEYNELMTPVYLAGISESKPQEPLPIENPPAPEKKKETPAPQNPVPQNNSDKTDYLALAQKEREAKNWQKAAQLYQKSADQENAVGQCRLAELLLEGRGVGQNYSKAMELFKKSADQNYEGAFYGLGVCYEFGRGTWMDYGKAREFYQKAADKNYALAQYRLGELYYSGLGVARDKAKAKDLWQKASANGSQEAAKRLKTANF